MAQILAAISAGEIRKKGWGNRNSHEFSSSWTVVLLNQTLLRVIFTSYPGACTLTYILKVRDVFFLSKRLFCLLLWTLDLNCDGWNLQGSGLPVTTDANVMPLKHVEEQMVCFPSKSVGLYVLGLCLARWQCEVTLLNLLACSHLKPVWATTETAVNDNASLCHRCLPNMGGEGVITLGDVETFERVSSEVDIFSLLEHNKWNRSVRDL